MSISRRRVVKDTLIYTVLPKIYVIASLLVIPLVSPFLSLDDFGIYGLITAYLSVFQILINLGQNVVLQNSFFEYKSRYPFIWRRVFGLMMLAGVLCALLFCGLLYWTMYGKLGNNFWPVCLMISGYLVLSPIEAVAVNYYVLHEKSFPYAICSAIVGVITAVVNLVFIRVFHWGYMAWVLALPVASVVMYIYYARRLFVLERLYPVLIFRRSFAVNALKVGLPLTPHQLSLYILGSSDRILLEYFKIPTARIGYYSQGYNLASYGNVFVGGVFQALARRLQEGFRSDSPESRTFIRKTMIITCVLISVVLSVAALWMKEAFRFLFRKYELQQAYPVAIVVICAYSFWATYSFFTYPLSIQKKTFSISRISLVAAAVNLIVNIFLIPIWGIWAAVGTTYFAYMIFGLAGIFQKENRVFLSKYVNITVLCLGMVGINILLFLIAYLCRDEGFWLKSGITIGILLGLAWVYKSTVKEKMSI